MDYKFLKMLLLKRGIRTPELTPMGFENPEVEGSVFFFFFNLGSGLFAYKFCKSDYFFYTIHTSTVR